MPWIPHRLRGGLNSAPHRLGRAWAPQPQRRRPPFGTLDSSRAARPLPTSSPPGPFAARRASPPGSQRRADRAGGEGPEGTPARRVAHLDSGWNSGASRRDSAAYASLWSGRAPRSSSGGGRPPARQPLPPSPPAPRGALQPAGERDAPPPLRRHLVGLCRAGLGEAAEEEPAGVLPPAGQAKGGSSQSPSGHPSSLFFFSARPRGIGRPGTSPRGGVATAARLLPGKRAPKKKPLSSSRAPPPASPERKAPAPSSPGEEEESAGPASSLTPGSVAPIRQQAEGAQFRDRQKTRVGALPFCSRPAGEVAQLRSTGALPASCCRVNPLGGGRVQQLAQPGTKELKPSGEAAPATHRHPPLGPGGCSGTWFLPGLVESSARPSSSGVDPCD